MKLDARPLRAAIYKRISKDTEGLALGVERQHEDCTALCARNGWTVAGVFCDNDISASTLSKKPRKDYEDMLARTRSGEFDVLVSYSNSRLTRRPLEMEGLISLHEATGVRLSTVASGDDDLSTATGRMVARIKASVDAREAEETAEKVKRKLKQRREAGLPHNGYPRHGYTYAKATGYVVDEDTRELYKTTYKRIADGEPKFTLMNEWNDLGIRTAGGNVWTPDGFSRNLLSGMAAGLIREHDDPSVKSRALASYTYRKGSHEAIIGRVTWDAFLERMLDHTTTAKRRIKAVRGLSGMLVCPLCKNTYYTAGTSNDGRRNWFCRNARDKRAHPTLYVSDIKAQLAVLDWLDENIQARGDVNVRAAEIAAEAKVVDSSERLATELAKLSRRRAKVQEGYDDGVYTADEAKARLKGVDAEMAEIQRQQAEMAKAIEAASSNTVEVFTALRDGWTDFNPHDQREALLTVLKHVVAHPPAQPGGEVRFEFVPAWDIE